MSAVSSLQRGLTGFQFGGKRAAFAAQAFGIGFGLVQLFIAAREFDLQRIDGALRGLQQYCGRRVRIMRGCGQRLVEIAKTQAKGLARFTARVLLTGDGLAQIADLSGHPGL